MGAKIQWRQSFSLVLGIFVQALMLLEMLVYVPLSALYQHWFGSVNYIWSKYGTMFLSSGIERSKSQHVSRLVLLNMLFMLNRMNTHVTGCIYVLGVSKNRWYWACALWMMDSSPPFTATIPYLYRHWFGSSL